MKLSDKIRRARKGLNIFYYGKGKGKTTALMGLAVRAAGAGMDVYILQFVKSKKPAKNKKLQPGEWPISSEMAFFEASAKKVGVGKIVTEQCGAGFVGILGDQKEKSVHIKEARKGLQLAKKIIKSDKYDLIILDELVSALELGLLDEKDMLALIKSKPAYMHLAYSGHDAYKGIISASDLVSEIKMIKHPYYKGILAQRGIDF